MIELVSIPITNLNDQWFHMGNVITEAIGRLAPPGTVPACCRRHDHLHGRQEHLRWQSPWITIRFRCQWWWDHQSIWCTISMRFSGTWSVFYSKLVKKTSLSIALVVIADPMKPYEPKQKMEQTLRTLDPIALTKKQHPEASAVVGENPVNPLRWWTFGQFWWEIYSTLISPRWNATAGSKSLFLQGMLRVTVVTPRKVGLKLWSRHVWGESMESIPGFRIRLRDIDSHGPWIFTVMGSNDSYVPQMTP